VQPAQPPVADAAGIELLRLRCAGGGGQAVVQPHGKVEAGGGGELSGPAVRPVARLGADHRHAGRPAHPRGPGGREGGLGPGRPDPTRQGAKLTSSTRPCRESAPITPAIGVVWKTVRASRPATSTGWALRRTPANRTSPASSGPARPAPSAW